jgi:hypothetical protein
MRGVWYPALRACARISRHSTRTFGGPTPFFRDSISIFRGLEPRNRPTHTPVPPAESRATPGDDVRESRPRLPIFRLLSSSITGSARVATELTDGSHGLRPLEIELFGRVTRTEAALLAIIPPVIRARPTDSSLDCPYRVWRPHRCQGFRALRDRDIDDMLVRGRLVHSGSRRSPGPTRKMHGRSSLVRPGLPFGRPGTSIRARRPSLTDAVFDETMRGVTQSACH